MGCSFPGARMLDTVDANRASRVTVAPQKSANAKLPSAATSPYPALFAYPSRATGVYPQSRTPSGSKARKRAGHSVPRNRTQQPSRCPSIAPSVVEADQLPATTTTRQSVPPKLDPVNITDESDGNTYSMYDDDVAFVRKYDLFPRQWEYLERYASAQRDGVQPQQPQQRSQYGLTAILGEDSDDIKDQYGGFFTETLATIAPNKGEENRLHTPTQSFVWLALVENILDDQERQERVDAARSIGHSSGYSLSKRQRQGTQPGLVRPQRTGSVTPAAKVANPLDPSRPPALTSVRMQLPVHGVPQPQPNLEDPRPERATRRERMAAHRKSRNYQKICGFTLDTEARWVDSPKQLSL